MNIRTWNKRRKMEKKRNMEEDGEGGIPLKDDLPKDI